MIDVAKDLKAKHAAGQVTDYLKNKTFFMIFYNASLRTRNSFEAGMTQLGGHAHDLTVEKIYSPIAADDRRKQLEAGKELKETHEEITETARVLSRYGHGIGVKTDAPETYESISNRFPLESEFYHRIVSGKTIGAIPEGLAVEPENRTVAGIPHGTIEFS